MWQSALQFLPGIQGLGDSGIRSGGQRQVVNALISHLCKFHVHFKLLNVFSSLFFFSVFSFFCSSPTSSIFFLAYFFHRPAFVGQAKTKLWLLLSETEVAGEAMVCGGNREGLGNRRNSAWGRVIFEYRSDSSAAGYTGLA